MIDDEVSAAADRPHGDRQSASRRAEDIESDGGSRSGAGRGKGDLADGGDRIGSTVVPFDGARILQVLCNLLSNALKFTPAQGSIVVRLALADDDVICCVSDSSLPVNAQS